MRNRTGRTKALVTAMALCVISLGAAAHRQTEATSNKLVDLSNPDVAQIVEIAKDFETWNKIGDVKHIEEVYSPDLVYMYQGMPSHDKAMIREMYEDFFSKNTAQVSVHIEEVKIFGNYAFDRATFISKAIPKDGSESPVIKGRVMELLRKEGGKWKSLRVMANTEE
jgi:ketosteroid isomerase-like protein